MLAEAHTLILVDDATHLDHLPLLQGQLARCGPENLTSGGSGRVDLALVVVLIGVGFLLGGIGELNKNREPNFLVVDKNTPLQDIEDTVKGFMKRSDISIILINQNIAEMVGFC